MKWKFTGSAPTETERAFIENHVFDIYHNDLTCVLWAFDTKLPSGRWLENIRFSNDLKSASAYIEPSEE